jgi:glycyl-tRNA synthetase beta chain
VLSLADKADTLAGMFSLGLIPSGSKDPFALRRQANGIVKILAEHKMPLRITRLFELAREAYKGSAAEAKFAGGIDYAGSIENFFRERVEFYLRDQLGYRYDVVNAAMAAGADDVVDLVARARAVSEVRASVDFDSISVAFKRIKNILRQAADTGKRIRASVDRSGLREPAESNLAREIPRIASSVETLRQKRDYVSALEEISKIRPAVDAFFDKVMVMVEDDELRANRLALLDELLREFSSIADFSEMVTEAKPV